MRKEEEKPVDTAAHLTLRGTAHQVVGQVHATGGRAYARGRIHEEGGMGETGLGDSALKIERKNRRDRTSQLLSALKFNSRTSASVSEWANLLVKNTAAASVSQLAQKGNGWHFSAANAEADQILEFQIEEMAQDFRQQTPDLWSLVCSLLTKGEEDIPMNESVETEEEEEKEDEEDDDEAEYWVDKISDDLLLAIEEPRLEGSSVTQSSAQEVDPIKRLSLTSHQRLRRALIVIKAVTIISICMQSQVQHCNAFQSTMGIFLHSCNAPEKLIKVLSHMGTSISLPSIHHAIRSLSRESHHNVRSLGQTLLAAFAYDNLDIKFNTLISTKDDPGAGLIHLTTGSLFQLDHGVTIEDLRCSKLLWDRSPYNPKATDPRFFDPVATFSHLSCLHPEDPHMSGLTRRGQFNSWCFAQTILKHGPPSLQHLLSSLPDPDPVEMIPITKLHQVPIPAMDINPSTVSGNIKVLETFLSQCGLGDSLAAKVAKMDIVDMSEMVSIVHGDLGCFEKVLSGLKRRSVEFTELERLQFVVFVMGLFHTKMAAADAIWRIVMPIKGGPSRHIEESIFLKLVRQLRPNQWGKIQSSAKFRDQHELINEVGTVLRLDAWRVELQKRGFSTHEEWAKSEPGLSEVREIADTLASQYVEGEGVRVWKLRAEAPSIRDEEHENVLLVHQYLLLYEELSYAFNAGDIGRVETLLPPWISLFRSTGKHKYCTRLLFFMHQLHFVYPEGLRRAIRYNILVNPTGKPHQFRAADWVIELLNLYIKVSHGTTLIVLS
ncbi:hypothetical protein NLI96_g13047 [Meripilus lineatus]|uniref:DUF6589 domain-containing protein n=1 Tax=Meripilus lineatus TaxID=2056292 RepID=A0AAD5Y725_9APHY|nr:hypothetical protein NLI96_g13047 [Physisporinus lineatus]